MFYFRVENISDGRAGKRLPDWPEPVIVEGDRIRVTAMKGELYAFYLYREPDLLIGESLWPLSDDELTGACEQLQAGNHRCINDGNILTIAVINTRDGGIEVYRSRSCSRPVYFCNGAADIICTSHLQLMKDGGISLELNQEMIPEFFVYRFIMPPETLFKNIQYLPGGWRLSANVITEKIDLQSLWNASAAQSNCDIPKPPRKSISSRCGRTTRSCWMGTVSWRTP